MIDKLISFSLKQKYLVLFSVGILVAFGIYTFQKLPIDAFPDVTNIQVQVISKGPGMSPVEVEQLITFPLEVEFMGLPNKTELRSISRYGLSVITVVFDDSTDIYWARQLLLERLIQAKDKLPKNVETALGPISTGLGDIYQYTLQRTGDGSKTGDAAVNGDLMEMRTVQDWIIRPILRTVPGVADVNSLGGYPKQYQIIVSPDKLKKYNLTLQQVFDAISVNNENAGGGYLRHQQESYVIRGLGLLKSIQDIENITISSIQGIPISIKDVAQVQIGSRYRLGGVTKDGKGEAVQGIVLMLRGGNSRDIVEAVKEKTAEINKILPHGLKMVPFYDRATLVDQALSTISKSLIEGVILVIIVLYLFLRNFRGAMVVALTLPLAVLSTFVVMKYAGFSANLMTLGGLAISLGMIVDAAIIQVENVQRHLSEKGASGHRPLVVLESILEVRKPSLFGELIIAVTFLPLFALEGIEGKMFGPLAFTVVTALLSSLVLSIFVIPVLCLIFLRPGQEGEPPLLGTEQGEHLERRAHARSKAQAVYHSLLRNAFRNRTFILSMAAGLFGLSLLALMFVGKEFMPTMDEGSIAVSVIRLPSIALEDSLAMTSMVEKELLKFPEVKTIVSRTGADEVGTDPMGPELSDVFISLHPRDTWRFKTKEELENKMREALEDIPGIAFGFSQPIQMRVDELISGVKSQLAIKLFGEDLKVLQDKAAEIVAAVKHVKGVADLRMERVSGQYYVEIEADRNAMARYGINVADLNTTVSAINYGKIATETIEGQKRFTVLVRLSELPNWDVASLGNIPFSASNGAVVPLKQIARIRITEGPSNINREEGQRRIVVEANVQGRDIAGFVKEAQKAIAEKVTLPPGYHLVWGGQFQNQQRAMNKLMLIVPLSILVVFFLLYSTFNSSKYALLILVNIPFAMIGGIAGLLISGQYLSVPASVGFITLFGVAVLNGLVLISYINSLREKGLSLDDAIAEGCDKRVRPVLMTALVAILGLVPLLFASGPGSEIQKPLATVVVGGLFTSTLLTLVVLPVIYRWVEEKTSNRN